MSKTYLKIQRDVPLKIYQETFSFKKDTNHKSGNTSYTKSSKNQNLNLDINDSLMNNTKISKSSKKINNRISLSKGKFSKFQLKKLYHYNSSSDFSNLNTQNNSLKENTRTNSNQNIKIIYSNNNSSFSNSNEKSMNNSNLKKLFNKNLLSFEDRKKMKKLNSTTVLRLYELYLQRKNQKLQLDELMPINRTFSNGKIVSNNDFIINNIVDNGNNNSSNNSNYKSLKTKKLKASKKFDKYKRKYTLNELMKLNPYHLVSNQVKFSDSEEMKNISEKLSKLNNNKTRNNKYSYKPLFFKNSFLKNKKLGKMVKNYFVQYNDNVSYNSDFIWRILSIMKKVQGYSSFYNACLFKGYYELWKNYSMMIEQLLVKNPFFKWFIEKNKYMKKEVFDEFISCMELNTKNNHSFTNKVYLLFREDELINIKLFLVIMELISDSDDMVEKVNFLGDFLTDYKLRDEEKCINVSELYNIFKVIFNSSHYKRDFKCMYGIFKKEFNNDKKIDSNLYASKNQICDLLLNNKFFKKKFDEFMINYKNADYNYEEQINQHFYSNARAFNNLLEDANIN